MKNIKTELLNEIKNQYDSVSQWLKLNDIRSDQFYNWKKGQSTIQVSTLERWANTLGMTVTLKKLAKKSK